MHIRLALPHVHTLVMLVEMRLADQGGAISGALQNLKESFTVRRHFTPVGPHAVIVWIQAIGKRRSGRHTNGRYSGGLTKAHPPRRQAIDVGRPDIWMARATQAVGTQLVGHQDQYVGSGHRFSGDQALNLGLGRMKFASLSVR